MEMLTKNIDEMKSEISAHIAADAVIQGKYWKNGKGCFIGCLTHSHYADVVSEKYGIPLAIVYLLEGIFEDLPPKESVKFFGDIGDAISVDNKDLSKIHYAFMRDMLKRLPERTKTTQAVIAGLDLLSQGKDWPEQEDVYDAAARAADDAWADAEAPDYAAEATRYVADYAAYDEAYAAAEAADYAAYEAARAASNYTKERKLQAASMIQLLEDAPIMENKQ